MSVLTVVNTDGTTPGGASQLDEIVREGTCRMLAAALEAEVNSYIAELSDQRDENGRRLVVRNGYHQPRKVTTAAGCVEVRAPRVNDKRGDAETGGRKRFSSAILAPQVPEDRQGAAAALSARSVQRRLHPGDGAVPRLLRRIVAGHRDPG